MTTASQFSGQTLTPSQLVHYNALLGLASWSNWSELVFQQSNLLTWYRSPIRDMLFNSVVAASLEEDDFRTAFREVVDYSERGRCPIAWLVAEPKLLSETHRSLFREYGFDERQGTTAMYRSLSAGDENTIPKPGDDGRRVEVVQDDEQLRTWAKLIFASYGFPA
ncbi:hypothetical protein MRY87_01410, partial [bacterium]|nr:hypothetical protein [bacterium]